MIPCEVTQTWGDKRIDSSLSPRILEEANRKSDSDLVEEIKILKAQVNDLKNEGIELRNLVFSLKNEIADLKTKINIVKENRYYLP